MIVGTLYTKTIEKSICKNPHKMRVFDNLVLLMHYYDRNLPIIKEKEMSEIQKRIVELLKKVPPYERQSMMEAALRKAEECCSPYPVVIDMPLEELLKIFKEKLGHVTPDAVLNMVNSHVQLSQFKEKYKFIVELEKYEPEYGTEYSSISVPEFIAFNLIGHAPEECKIFMKFKNKRLEDKYLICTRVWHDFHNPEAFFSIESRPPCGENVFTILEKKPA